MAAKKQKIESDRWTSNGLGIVSDKVSPERKAAVDRINKELAAKKAKAKGGKAKK